MGKESNKVSDGIKHICSILESIGNFSDESAFKDMGRYIFRGITRFYPDDESFPQNKLSVGNKYSPEEVENGYIKSGLSIRLYKTAKISQCDSAYIRANYINTLEELINNAKKHYPTKYEKELSDLDILADIQHNGGATCLVDFSKNILTSLWFACSGDSQYDGYVYCYDYINDMIRNDAITYIRPDDEKKSIRDLVSQTYKETNISSDITARFCLWEPSTRNNRILRQDSIFLFGIEKFHVKTHDIKVIRIPAECKENICFALRNIFNITGSVIFNDPAGYATTNSKDSPYHKLCTSSYNRGYSNMIKGNYISALDFFKLWEGEHYSSMTLEQKLELHFSIAVCYKNLRRRHGEISYCDNAIMEYKEVIELAHKLIPKYKDKAGEEKQLKYFQHKCTRAYNSILDLKFDYQRFFEAIDICDKIIMDINNDILDNPNNSNNPNNRNREYAIYPKKNLNPKYCRIVKMELLNLHLLYYSYNEDISDLLIEPDFQVSMNKYYDEALKQCSNSSFDKLLIEYYLLIFNIIVSEYNTQKYNSFLRKMIELRDTFNGINLRDKDTGYILWNFADMKEAINKLPNTPTLLVKKRLMQQITAYAISVRDKIEMYSWGRSDEL